MPDVDFCALTEQTSPNDPVYTAAVGSIRAAFGFDPAQALAYFERILNAQAVMLGLNDILRISGAIFVVVTPLIWLTLPITGTATDAVATH